MWVFKKANVIKYMQLPIGEKKKMEERKERREPKKKKNLEARELIIRRKYTGKNIIMCQALYI